MNVVSAVTVKQERSRVAVGGALLSTLLITLPLAVRGGESKKFDIDSQPLSAALAQLSEQSGVTPDGVKIEAAPKAAVSELPRIVVRDDGAAAMTSYTVQNASAGTKADTPLMETPLTVQVVPQQVIRDLGVTSSGLSDVLIYDGVQTRGYAPDTELLIFRGFETSSTIWNGFRIEEELAVGGEGNGGVWMDNVESLEVMKGPSSILYGRSEPGGTINILTRKPQADFALEIRGGGGSWSDRWLGVDVTGPLNRDETLSYRLNLAGEASNSYFRYGPDYGSAGVAPALQWRISPQTTLSLEGQYRNLRGGTNTSYIPIDPATGRPIQVGRSITYPRDILVKYYQDRTMIALEHHFDASWSLSWKVMHDQVDNPVIRYIFDRHPQFPISPAGALTISRHSYASKSNTRTDASILDLTGHLTSFAVNHTLLLGAEYYYYRYGGSQGYDFSDSPANTADYFNPTPYPFGQLPLDNPLDIWRRAPALYAQDQLALPWDWHVLLGLRYQRLQEFVSAVSNTDYGKYVAQPRVGLLWRARPWISAYYNYSVNMGVSNGFAFPDVPLKPETSKEHELGVKTQWLNDRLSVTLALFDITKYDIAAADPVHPAFNIAVGEVQSRGFEVNAQGSLTDSWNVLINYSDVRPEVIRGAENANTIEARFITAGQRLPYVSDRTFSILSGYKLPGQVLRGWSVGGGANWASPANPVAGATVSPRNFTGYTVASVFANYETDLGGYGTTIQLNVNNVFDEKYLFNFQDNGTVAGGNWGPPRQFKASVRMRL